MTAGTKFLNVSGSFPSNVFECVDTGTFTHTNTGLQHTSSLSANNAFKHDTLVHAGTKVSNAPDLPPNNAPKRVKMDTFTHVNTTLPNTLNLPINDALAHKTWVHTGANVSNTLDSFASNTPKCVTMGALTHTNTSPPNTLTLPTNDVFNCVGVDARFCHFFTNDIFKYSLVTLV